VKAAFAHWDNRIAPVFDVARQIHLVEAKAGRIVGEATEILPHDPPALRANRMAGLNIDTLVCGAISKPLHGMLTAHGIHVIPFIAGDLGKVIQAWLRGRLDGSVFAMPGCRGRGYRGAGRTIFFNQEGYMMNGRGQGRMGQGGGQGRGGRRPGRMGGPAAAGPSGYCVCPRCGQRESHVTGIPCVQQKCPKCGTGMMRQ
jgi:predicted Fe-Mo cluster-binding NifX family protein